MREYTETGTQIAALRATLQEMSLEFSGLAKQLVNEPEDLFPIGQAPSTGRFSHGHYFARPNKLSISRVLEMVEQLREALIKEENLGKQLSQLGIPPLR